MELFTEARMTLGKCDCWCLRAESNIDDGDLSAAHDSLTRAQEIDTQHKGGEYAWRIPLIRVRLAIAGLTTQAGESFTTVAEQVIDQARSLVEESRTTMRMAFTIESHPSAGIHSTIKPPATGAQWVITAP